MLSAGTAPFVCSPFVMKHGLAMLTKTLELQHKDVIEPLIAQARCSIRDRIIVGGTQSAELMFELHKRGYLRVTTTASSAVAGEEYNVALMDWRARSIKTLGATLHWLLGSLDQDATVVVWVDSSDPFAGKIRSLLRKCGLTVQADAVRDNGTIVSARCRESGWRPRPL
jgi:hypothetical protein